MRLVNRGFCQLIDQIEEGEGLAPTLDMDETQSHYDNYRECIADKGVNKKTINDKLVQPLWKHQDNVIKMLKSKGKKTEYNFPVFILPRKFWALFDALYFRDTRTSTSFKEIA